MTNMVHFNVGGKQYEVSCSLLEMYPNTMLARSASEQWLPNPDAEVFVERDGIRFAFVLDYLRDNGHVILPMTVPKPSFLADLVYYGVENIDERKIAYKYCADTKFLAHAVHEINTEIHPQFSADVSVNIRAEIRAEIKALDSRCNGITLAEECANRFLSSGGKLKITIYGPYTNLPRPQNTSMCSEETWMELLSLLCDDGTRILSHAQVECNKFLSRIGLEIASAMALPDRCLIHVVLMLTDI